MPNRKGNYTMEKLQKIYDKFKTLKDEAVVDCNFDKGKLESQFNNTLVIMKWINYRSEWNQVYRVYENKRKETYRKLYEFYKLEYDLKINTKEELSLFIESDVQYTEVFNICQVLKEILQYISDVVDNLKGKNFEIQRYLNYLQFINGK